MNVDDDSARRARLRDLLDADGKGERVEAGAAVLARDEDSEQARAGGRPDSFFGEAMLPIYLFREGLDDALRQLTDRLTKGRVVGSEF